MSWRIVYIESKDYLSLYLDNVKIKRPDREVILPLRDINSIVIDNDSAVITSALIAKCSQYNVSIMFCGEKHLPESLILSFSGNYRSSRLLEYQIAWKDSSLDVLWKGIVQSKIQNQIEILEKKEIPEVVVCRMKNFIREVRSFDEGNCEGLAAKMYFRALFGKEFTREEDCFINAALNYGYSIIRSAMARVLVAHGLNPQLGIFHRGARNDFNLVDDLLEPFRPVVDFHVYEMSLERELFCRKHRLALLRIPTKKVKYKGKKITIFFAMNKVVEELAFSLQEGVVETLTFPESISYDI